MAQVVEGVLAAYGAYEAAKGAVDEIKQEAKQVSDLVHDAGGPQNLGSGRPTVLDDYFKKRKFSSIESADPRGAYNPRPVRRARVARRTPAAPRRPQRTYRTYGYRSRSAFRRYRRKRYRYYRRR